MSAAPRAARLPRRALATLVDLGFGALPVALALWTSTLDPRALSTPPGWFWSEWLLSLWLDRPGTLTAPILWWGIFTLLWQGGWELFTGRSPGARLLGLELRSMRDGERARPWQVMLRLMGIGLEVLTLGLGYALVFITREGRSLHELISHTVVTRASR